MSDTARLVRVETEVTETTAADLDALEGKGRAEKLRRAVLRLIELEKPRTPD